MAIVIKVKADTKELEQDLKKASAEVQKSINVKTGPITEQFNKMRTAAKDMTARVDELRKSTGILDSTLGASAVRWLAYGGAIAFAKKHTIDMVKETAKLNDELLETSLKTGKTVEKMQQLIKGGRDLTGELRTLGAVLSYETIKKASQATDGFALLDKQLGAVKTRITAELSDALQGLGRSLADAMSRVGPIVVRMATSVGNAIETITPLLNRTLDILVRINELQETVGLPFTGTLGRRALSALFPEPAPSRTATLALGHTPTLTPSTELRDFLRSPITHERLLEQRARDARRRTRTPRAPSEAPISQEAQIALGLVDANLQSMTKSAEDLFEEIVANNREIAALSAKLEDLRQRGYAKHSDAIKLQTEEMVLSIHTRNLETAAIAKENEEREKSGRLITQRIAREDITFRETRAARGGRFAATAALNESDEDFRKRRLLEQRQARGGLTEDFLKEEEKAAEKLFEEVRQQAIQFKEGIVRTFESAFREGFERGPKAFLQATASAIKSFFSQIAAELSTGIIELILFGKGGISGRGVGTTGALGGLRASLGGFGGGGGGAGGGGGVAGFFGGGGGGGGGIGGFISKFLGGGGGSSSTIGVAPSLSAFSGVAGGDFAGNLLTLSQGGTIAGAAAGGGGALGGLAGFAASGGIGALAIGGLLGIGVGGKSTAGKILGGIGGGLAGLAAFTGIAGALTGGIIGAVAGLAATGIGLIAAPLLIGAYFLGKAKQRRNDEQAADAIWVAERDQVRELINAVNADRIDGPSALAQAQALRSQTVQQLQQIKTKSVRDSRLTNQLRDLDNGVIAELRAAVARQATRGNNRSFLVPEFESGGYVRGVDMGYDSVTARLRPGELVLTRSQQRSIQARAGSNVFAEVGVGGSGSAQRFQNGGYVRAPDPGGQIINIVLEGDAAEIAGSLIVKGVTTSGGQRAIVNVIKTSRRNGDL